MRLIKMGLANINTTVGAFVTNTKKIIFAMEEMSRGECTIGSFQEQVIPGYPCEDLIQWKSFIDKQWACLEQIRETSGNLAFPTVFTLGLTLAHKGHLYNSLALVCGGEILGIVPKEKLPTYGIFYDGRTFSRGLPGMAEFVENIPFGDYIFSFPFGVVGVEVCEDIWSPDGPMRRRAYSGAEVIINASASPYRVGIVDTRRELISTRASDNQVTLMYVNQLGGNDSLVFDGGGFLNQNGQMIKEFPRWEEGIHTTCVDLDRSSRLRYENTTWRSDCENFFKEFNAVDVLEYSLGGEPNRRGYRYPLPGNKSFFIPGDEKLLSSRARHYEDILNALVMGLDYYVKTGAFKKLGIALSGGKDSLLTLVLAWLFAHRRFKDLPEKERKEKIFSFIECFSMPTRFNSETTKGISATICEELGVSLKEIPLQDIFEKELEITASMLPDGEEVTSLTRQNIQARIRGERMQNWANSSGGMWIQTGNMSEKAVGYTTIGGDMMGAYSLIANLPKTLVIDLLRYIHEKYGWKGVGTALATKASAELQDDQEDERDLMPFPVLDGCMFLFAEEKKSPGEVFEIIQHMWNEEELKEMYSGYTPGLLKEWVYRFSRLFKNSIFKWVQTPQAVHIGKLELDRERALQLPVVQSGEWMD